MKTLFTFLTIMLSNYMIAQTGWNLQTNPLGYGEEAMIGKVQFVSPTEGWISGSRGDFLHTTDAGANWMLITPFPDDTVWSPSDAALSMSWVNPTHGWKINSIGPAYGNSYGVVIHQTNDGGNTWQKKLLTTTQGDFAVQIQFVDINNGWLLIFNFSTQIATFMKTTDGGNNWVPFSGAGIFYYADANNGWSFYGSGQNGSEPPYKILRTTSGGANWTEQYTDNLPGGYNAMYFSDINNGWIVGDAGKVLKTIDGGTNWSVVTNSGINSNDRSKTVFFLDANNGWISSKNDNGYAIIQHTTDGATTWATQGTPIENPQGGNAIFSIYFIDAENGWLTADYGIICHIASNGNSETVFDYDGNEYQTITLGNQTWMAENLRVTHYNNGDAINTTFPDTLDISFELSPKYKWASNRNENIVTTYGRLYTWYAATDSRGVCPTGWHIPTDTEWTILESYLTNNGFGYQGNGNDIAKSMAASSVWAVYDTAGTVGNNQSTNNSSGFSAFPAGIRERSGYYNGFGSAAWWWSITPDGNGMVWSRNLDYNIKYLLSSTNYYLNNGFSIRCIKDAASTDLDYGEVNQTPRDFSLSQNYPNPFNPSTKIRWQSLVSSWQTLKVYDVLGNEITTLVDEFRSSGEYEINFDATGLPTGMYFYKLQAGSFVETKKMILLR